MSHVMFTRVGHPSGRECRRADIEVRFTASEPQNRVPQKGDWPQRPDELTLLVFFAFSQRVPWYLMRMAFGKGVVQYLLKRYLDPLFFFGGNELHEEAPFLGLFSSSFRFECS